MPSINNSKCVLVTGATSGIGRALAEAISKLPSQPEVIGAGRRPDRLKELENIGIHPAHLELDTDANSLKKAVKDIAQKFPDADDEGHQLDTIILNAGIQRIHNFLESDEADLEKLHKEMNINYHSILTVITSILPHFKKLAAAGRPCMIVTVTSVLGVVPAQHVPNYSASKAALHSLTLSLQSQFQGTNIHFIEILPPNPTVSLVESELHDADGTTEKLSKQWMPLDEFIPATMEGLKKGEPHIGPGVSGIAFGRYEKEKYQLVMQKETMGSVPESWK
ncbi:hypothetical protein V5O48_000796 [Marasmius crinis-equi]|uniref:NAD(P)-binding protein n=1 Tax=Marasmius crinis-equi TaxID=585013 RepID=A0ABR3G046_9AGAR